MNILSLESVSKRFGSGPLLEDVSFGLEHDEKMGLIGRNGCGKTTLLRIIAGVESLDSGRVTLANNRRVGYLPQNPTFESDQTVLDAVFDQGNEKLRLLHDYEAACQDLEISGGANERLLARVSDLSHQLDVTGGWELEANAKAVLNQLGITDISAKISTLSGGQRKRVALARGLVLRPDLLILDEPTNHLDADTIAWLEGYLTRYSGALFLVTHDRYFLDRVANRMLEIERGKVQRFEGNYTTYLEKKEEQAIQREGEAIKREGLMRRELAWLRQGAQARSTKQKAHVERAKALLAAPKIGPDQAIELSAPSARLGNKILELDEITKAYDGRTLIGGFSYKLKRGDRIGIIGPNGSGKTTLLEIIAGRLQADSGRREVGETVVIGYYDQESRALDDEMRIIDYIKASAENIRTADGLVISASQMLERFLFTPAAQYTPIGRLSGGEKRRLYLLRLLMGAPNVLLLDEPTNDFDIATLVALEAYLDSFPGCLIVASHDRYFLDRTIDQLFRLEPGGNLRGYPGNYSAYMEIKERENAVLAEALVSRETKADKTKKQISETAPSGPRKRTFKERREFEELETRIASSEARKAEIEAQLSSGAAEVGTISVLASELQTLTDQLDRDVERWAELAELE